MAAKSAKYRKTQNIKNIEGGGKKTRETRKKTVILVEGCYIYYTC
jgi:uridine kinase